VESETQKLRKELMELLSDSQFKQYRKVFTKFGFGLNLQGYLLGACYPIQDFLKDGKPEVKIIKNRKTGKVSKLKLSERRFMPAVGMGVVREDSGKKRKVNSQAVRYVVKLYGNGASLDWKSQNVNLHWSSTMAKVRTRSNEVLVKT
jgi:hypothetical protein